MNGITRQVRGGAIAIGLAAVYLALLYEYGRRRETVEFLFDRWTIYQASCLKVALAALIISIVLSLFLWFGEKSRRAREHHKRRRETAQRRYERVQKLFAQMGCDSNGYPIQN